MNLIFAAIDAALGIDLIEVCSLCFADHSVSGRWSAIGHDVADFDLGIGRTYVIFFLGKCAGAGCRKYDNGCRQHVSRNWKAGMRDPLDPVSVLSLLGRLGGQRYPK